MTNPKELKAVEEKRITMHQRWLTCKDIRQILYENFDWLTSGHGFEWKYWIEQGSGDLVLQRK